MRLVLIASLGFMALANAPDHTEPNAASHAASVEPQDSVPWRRLPHTLPDGSPGAVYAPWHAGVAVIRDSARWAAVWRIAMPGEPRPSIDFGRETIIAISYGPRSGCWIRTRHIVRVAAGQTDTVWVDVMPAPRPAGPSCDGMFSMADLVVIGRRHATIVWRSAEGSRPVPSDSLWRSSDLPRT